MERSMIVFKIKRLLYTTDNILYIEVNLYLRSKKSADNKSKKHLCCKLK